VLAKDVEDRGREVGVFTVLDELAQNAESHVLAFRQLWKGDE
jgi:hypothetical protein